MIIGIDPGLAGAIAALRDDGALIGVADMPASRWEGMSWVNGRNLTSILLELRGGLEVSRVIIERAQPMPKQGVSSSFHYGMGFGAILAVCESMMLPMEFVHPSKWKRYFGLIGDNKRKSAALDKARVMFPAADLCMVKHDGRAEALLIAEWRRRQP